jgi:hypothetical protein
VIGRLPRGGSRRVNSTGKRKNSGAVPLFS